MKASSGQPFLVMELLGSLEDLLVTPFPSPICGEGN